LYSKRELGNVIKERIWGERKRKTRGAGRLNSEAKAIRLKMFLKIYPFLVYSAVIWNGISERTSTDGNGN
jgi:hypothetical protein